MILLPRRTYFDQSMTIEHPFDGRKTDFHTFFFYLSMNNFSTPSFFQTDFPYAFFYIPLNFTRRRFRSTAPSWYFIYSSHLRRSFFKPPPQSGSMYTDISSCFAGTQAVNSNEFYSFCPDLR